MTQIKKPTQQDLLQARAHLGHLSRKWDPSFAPYIFMKKNDIHIIDVNHTLQCLTKAVKPMKEIIENGKKILFVGTKKIAKSLIKNAAEKIEQPYITERWLGGSLTNFATIRKLLKKLANMHLTPETPNYQHLTKREQLTFTRKKVKLEKNLKGLSSIHRLPEAVFVVDIKREQTCIKEANKLGIPIFAIVDTNSSPQLVDYPIPANDDAVSSVATITNYLVSELEQSHSVWKTNKKKDKA